MPHSKRSLAELAWIAGLLERSCSLETTSAGLRLSFSTHRRDLAERFVALIGGRLYARADGCGFTIKRTGAMTAGLLMTMWPLMTPAKRQEFADALESWRLTRHYVHGGREAVCGHGKARAFGLCRACYEKTPHARQISRTSSAKYYDKRRKGTRERPADA